MARRRRVPVAVNGTVGAVVVGGDYNGLGIVRSLGRHGVPVVVVDDEPSISRYSRYAGEVVRVESLLEADDVVRHLLEIGERLGLRGWVLYAVRDEIVAAIASARDELAQIYRVPTPRADVIDWALDKRRTYQRAQELGIAIPETWQAESVDDLDAPAANLPVALKPAIKEHFIYVTKVKAWQANTPAELRELFERALLVIPADEILIQDVVPGGGEQQFSYCAFFKDGEASASMTVRRTRQRPYDYGRSSTYVETVDLPEIEEQSQRYLASIGYYGLAEIEYKLDPRDGEYRLLDVNPRTWGYHSIGPAAGVDFPYVLYCDQLGRTLPPVRARPGVRWFRLSTDLAGALTQVGKNGFDVRSYVKTLRAADVEAVFQRDDLLPGLAEIGLLPYLYKTRGSSRLVKVVTRSG